jgi:AcrR family transcriptional regulator
LQHKSKTRMQTPARSRAPREASAQRQQDILGITYDLISELGISGINMRLIAEAAGMSTGTINYYFKNKQRLIIAALEAAYRLPADWEQNRGSPAAQLRRLALGYVLRAPKDRFWRFWMNYTAHGLRDEEMRLHQQERYRRQEQFWAKLIRDAVSAGEFRSDLDPEQVARDLLMSAHGAVVRQLILNDASAREQARLTIDAILKGLSARKGNGARS